MKLEKQKKINIILENEEINLFKGLIKHFNKEMLPVANENDDYVGVAFDKLEIFQHEEMEFAHELVKLLEAYHRDEQEDSLPF